MFEKQPQSIRDNINNLAQESIAKNDPCWWFDVLYQQAKNDPHKIPWAKMRSHPYFQDWLDRLTEGDITPSVSVLVIGCGLGDDAEALSNKGFNNITAFDISPKAIDWCKKRFPDSAVNYVVADLFELDPSWESQFDLVYECRNIQALPLNVREEIIGNIGRLVAPQGILLVIDRLRADETQPSGPPWALSQSEFDLFHNYGLQTQKVDRFYDGDNQEVTTLRIEFKR